MFKELLPLKQTNRLVTYGCLVVPELCKVNYRLLMTQVQGGGSPTLRGSVVIGGVR